MTNKDTTYRDLVAERDALRARVAAFEQREAEWQKLEDVLRQRQSELESLLETSRDLSGVRAIKQLLPVIAERLTALLASDECVLFQLQPDGRTLHAIMALGPYADQIEGATMDIDQGLTSIVMQTGEPLIVNDAHDDPRVIRIPPPPKSEDQQAHVMIAPLRVRGRIIGAMVLNRVPGRPFTDTDLRLFNGFVQQVAVAIENSRLYDEIRRYTSELEQRVSERTAELQQQRDEMEAVINSVADGLLITDQDGTIMLINPALEHMTGFRAPELVGLNTRFMRFASSVSPEHIQTIWDTAREGGQVRLEMPIFRRNGTTFDADLSVATLSGDAEGEVRGFVVVIRDVTAVKEVQRMKDDFVSNVTHELRTPITSMKLRYDLVRAAPQRIDYHLSVLERETERLSLIIDDLLTLSRIDQGRTAFNLQPTDISVLAARLANDRRPLAEERGLDLRYDARGSQPVPAQVKADAGLLEQAISIIMTNAMSYTQAGGTITLATVTGTREGRDWAGVTIRDTGPGLTAKDCEKLFTRFFRGSAAESSSVAGTGLGLSIAKAIVDRHHGWIEPVSNEKRTDGQTGAIFTIWLPLPGADESGDE